MIHKVLYSRDASRFEKAFELALMSKCKELGISNFYILKSCFKTYEDYFVNYGIRYEAWFDASKECVLKLVNSKLLHPCSVFVDNYRCAKSKYSARNGKVYVAWVHSWADWTSHDILGRHYLYGLLKTKDDYVKLVEDAYGKVVDGIDNYSFFGVPVLPNGLDRVPNCETDIFIKGLLNWG